MTEIINPTTKKQLVFPEFDDIKVSTKTFIVMTNLVINLKNLFEFLPVTEYAFVPKKRGRKKKNNQINPNKDVQKIIEKTVLSLFPNHSFLGEENINPGIDASKDAIQLYEKNEHLWICDPIDGDFIAYWQIYVYKKIVTVY